MSNIEKIKAEIERLKNKNAEWRERINSEDGYSYESDVCCGYDEAIEDFESFIDSLPEEKPSEDFPTSDEEMAKFLATHPKVEVPEKYKAPNWLFDKQPSEDLEEAAENFVWEVMENDEDGISDLCRKLRPSSKISDFYDALAEFFEAGAKWQKEQMMKDAKEIITVQGSLMEPEFVKQRVIFLKKD